MKPSPISMLKILLIAFCVFLLTGCSAIDRMIHPGAKSDSSVKPAPEIAQKEEPTAKIEPETPVPTPSEQQPPPPPPPPPSPPRSPKPAPAPVLRVAQIVWSSVNLREGPGTNYKITGSAKRGSAVSILEDKGQWLRVRLEDAKEAWVFKSATSLAPKTPPASPPARPKPM